MSTKTAAGPGCLLMVESIGLLLENSFIPILAESPSTGIEAIFAEAANNGNFIAGIFGEGTGSTARTLGVEGVTASATGAGVYGENKNQSSTGSGFGTGSGVWGDAGTSNGAFGVVGTADDRNAIVAETTAPARTTRSGRMSWPAVVSRSAQPVRAAIATSTQTVICFARAR